MAKITDLFKGGGARTRLIIVVGVVIAFGVVAYLASSYLSGPATVTKATVANAPANLQSIPGGQLSPEYYRALMQSNQQTAKQATVSGTSAVSTLVNVPTSYGQSNCTVLCNEEAVDVSDNINDLLKNGKITQQDAKTLLDMAKNNVPVSEYEAELQRLVKEGKISPEEARRLLAEYKKQHGNQLAQQSAKVMDSLIKSGRLPVDVANQLLDLQKKNLSPEEYARELNRLVKEGKISPEVAAQLLAQYSQQKAKEAAEASAADLRAMARAGQIAPDVADQLANLQNQNVPASQYNAELNRLVAQGKMTPATAAALLAKYKNQKASFGPSATLSGMLAQAESDPNYPKNKLEGLRTTVADLQTAQANNVPASEYDARLRKAVADGVLTPEQATSLLQEYQSYLNPVPGGAGPTAGGPGVTPEFAALQERLAAQQATGAAPAAGPNADQFAAAQAQAAAEAQRLHDQRVQTLTASMGSQAQSIITAWQQVPNMQMRAGTVTKKTTTTTKTTTGSNAENPNGTQTGEEKPSLIKAGTIYYGMLTTAVDSDYPDTPVMATIVDGPFKGATLIGKLTLAQGQDRLSLNFNLMDMDGWPKSKTINAYAMDPDTARTVMASNVNHHYLLRYGTLFASSFLTGYANGITNEGTSTTGIFGTSTSRPGLSPGNKIAVALGQVGTAFSSAIGSYINTPATVRINSGVGIGILFVSEVT